MRRKVVVAVALAGVLGLAWFSWPASSRLLIQLDGQALGLALPPDALTLAVGTPSGVLLVDTSTGSSAGVATGEKLDPNSRLSWTADGKYLVWMQQGIPARTVVFDVADRKVIARLDGILPPRLLVSGRIDPVILVRDGAVHSVDTGSWMVGPAVAPGPCLPLNVNMAKGRIVCWHEGNDISIFDTRSGEERTALRGGNRGVSISPGGQWALVNYPNQPSENGKTDIVDLQTGNHRTVADSYFFNAAWISDDLVAVALGIPEDNVVVVSVSNSAAVRTGIYGSIGDRPSALHWSPGGQKLWAIGRSTYVRSWVTITNYYLYSYDVTARSVHTRRLRGTPSLAAWDDAHGKTYVVLDDNQLWSVDLR